MKDVINNIKPFITALAVGMTLVGCSSNEVQLRPEAVVSGSQWSMTDFTQNWQKAETSAEQSLILDKVSKLAGQDFPWNTFWESFNSNALKSPQDFASLDKLLALNRFACERSDYEAFLNYALELAKAKSAETDRLFDYTFGTKNECETQPAFYHFRQGWEVYSKEVQRLFLLEEKSAGFSTTEFWQSLSNKTLAWPDANDEIVHFAMANLGRKKCDPITYNSYLVFVSDVIEEYGSQFPSRSYIDTSIGKDRICQVANDPSPLKKILLWALRQPPSDFNVEVISKSLSAIRSGSTTVSTNTDGLVQNINVEDIEKYSEFIVSHSLMPNTAFEFYHEMNSLIEASGNAGHYPKLHQSLMSALFKGPTSLAFAISRFGLSRTIKYFLDQDFFYFERRSHELLPLIETFSLEMKRQLEFPSEEISLKRLAKDFSILVDVFRKTEDTLGKASILSLFELNHQVSIAWMLALSKLSETERKAWGEWLRDSIYSTQIKSEDLWLLSLAHSHQDPFNDVLDIDEIKSNARLIDRIYKYRIERTFVEEINSKTLYSHCEFLREVNQLDQKLTSSELKAKFKNKNGSWSLPAGCFMISADDEADFVKLNANEIVFSPDSLVFASGISFDLNAPLVIGGSFDLSISDSVQKDPAPLMIEAQNAISFPIVGSVIIGDSQIDPNHEACQEDSGSGYRMVSKISSSKPNSLYDFCKGEHFFISHIPFQFAETPNEAPAPGRDGRAAGSLFIRKASTQIGLTSLVAKGEAGSPSAAPHLGGSGDISFRLIIQGETQSEQASLKSWEDAIRLGTEIPVYFHFKEDKPTLISSLVLSAHTKAEDKNKIVQISKDFIDLLHKSDREQLLALCEQKINDDCLEILEAAVQRTFPIMVSASRRLSIADNFNQEEPLFFNAFENMKLNPGLSGPLGEPGSDGEDGILVILDAGEVVDE